CTTRRLPHSSGTLQGPTGAPPRSARPKSPRPPRRSVRGRSGAPRFPARVPAARGSGTTALRPPLSESREEQRTGILLQTPTNLASVGKDVGATAGLESSRAKSSIVPSSGSAGGHPHLHPYTGGDDHDTWTSTHLLPAAGLGCPGSHDLGTRRSRSLGADRRLGQ